MEYNKESYLRLRDGIMVFIMAVFGRRSLCPNISISIPIFYLRHRKVKTGILETRIAIF